VIGSGSKIPTANVAKLLKDKRSSVRSAAVKCLAKVEADQSKTIPILITALQDSDWTVRGDAAAELGEFGSAAKQAVPALFRMLASEDDTDAARGALRAIDDAGPESVPVLIEGLKSTDRRRQFYAIFLLGKIGPKASQALPVLRQLQEESDSKRGKEAYARAIKQIESQP
jgi:HEAT repeat protein